MKNLFVTGFMALLLSTASVSAATVSISITINGGIDLKHPRNNGAMLLGATRIDEGKDRDVMKLPACSSSRNKPVSHLKLYVAKYPVEIDRLKVVFQNGQKQELFVRDHFKVGTSSRWIDLKGPKRCIKKIVVIGDTDTPFYAPNKRAFVKLYGLK